MECQVRGCHNPVAGEIDLHADDLSIPVLLCREDYRKLWDAPEIGVFGGSGVE